FYFFPIFPEETSLEISIENEEVLGDLLVEEVLYNSPDFIILSNPTLDSAFDQITSRLLDSIGLTDYEYNIQIVENEQINAFTLPGGNIFVYSGLIDFAESPEEVAAVLSHEIGHVEKRHVVSRLIKEFGLNIIFSIATGGDGVILGELSRTALSTVFDRHQEKEADLYGLELMVRAQISPSALAVFFRRIKREMGDYSDLFEIFNSHPNSNSRIKASLEHPVPEGFKAIEFDMDWKRVQASLTWESEMNTEVDSDINRDTTVYKVEPAE
ncbi:MAG: M48 family metallopeptidase, partial [Flavobacteriales bacterium]|nr:M48 family metallopeptidase [Flavobacteriales bacterium]